MTTTETMPAEHWCGRLSETIRGALRAFENGEYNRGVDYLSDTIAAYERESGFPPGDAQIRAHVGHDMPLDYLKPGERLINGTIYYSERWLQDGLAEVPGAYRYVIFLNKAKTKMLTCWPQEDENVWKLETATRAYSDGTWGPPSTETFRGNSKQLERTALGRELPIKELAL